MQSQEGPQAVYKAVYCGGDGAAQRQGGGSPGSVLLWWYLPRGLGGAEAEGKWPVGGTAQVLCSSDTTKTNMLRYGAVTGMPIRGPYRSPHELFIRAAKNRLVNTQAQDVGGMS